MPIHQLSPRRERNLAVARLRARLEQHQHPRLFVLAAISLGAIGGLATSAGLLWGGVLSMAWRYGAAAVVGYAVFLVSLRVWLAFQGRQTGRAAHALDFLDGIPTGSGGGGSATVPEVPFGGGGGFSGGGGGASFDAHGLAPDADVVHVAHGVSLTEHLPDIAGDLGEGAVVVWPVLLVVCAIGVAVISAGAVVVEAPTLLAELLFDGVIAGVAYRRLRNVSTQHWLTGAVRRTVKPMLVLTLTLVACALIAQWLVPGARSIGDFFR